MAIDDHGDCRHKPHMVGHATVDCALDYRSTVGPANNTLADSEIIILQPFKMTGDGPSENSFEGFTTNLKAALEAENSNLMTQLIDKVVSRLFSDVQIDTDRIAKHCVARSIMKTLKDTDTWHAISGGFTSTTNSMHGAIHRGDYYQLTLKFKASTSADGTHPTFEIPIVWMHICSCTGLDPLQIKLKGKSLGTPIISVDRTVSTLTEEGLQLKYPTEVDSTNQNVVLIGTDSVIFTGETSINNIVGFPHVVSDDGKRFYHVTDDVSMTVYNAEEGTIKTFKCSVGPASGVGSG